MSPLGSGSHSPFSVHVAELGPVSSHPGGQLNLIVLPSIGTELEYSEMMVGTELELLFIIESLLIVDNSCGCPQLTVQ